MFEFNPDLIRDDNSDDEGGESVYYIKREEEVSDIV